MASDTILAGATALILGLGGGTGIATLYKARKTGTAERDSIVVGGAETAVLTLEKSLAAESRRADRAEAASREKDRQLAAKERRILALEKKIDEMQVALEMVRNELHQIRTAT